MTSSAQTTRVGKTPDSPAVGNADRPTPLRLGPPRNGPPDRPPEPRDSCRAPAKHSESLLHSAVGTTLGATVRTGWPGATTVRRPQPPPTPHRAGRLSSSESTPQHANSTWPAPFPQGVQQLRPSRLAHASALLEHGRSPHSKRGTMDSMKANSGKRPPYSRCGGNGFVEDGRGGRLVPLGGDTASDKMATNHTARFSWEGRRTRLHTQSSFIHPIFVYRNQRA